jgi:hypothetical protein
MNAPIGLVRLETPPSGNNGILGSELGSDGRWWGDIYDSKAEALAAHAPGSILPGEWPAPRAQLVWDESGPFLWNGVIASWACLSWRQEAENARRRAFLDARTNPDAPEGEYDRLIDAAIKARRARA